MPLHVLFFYPRGLYFRVSRWRGVPPERTRSSLNVNSGVLFVAKQCAQPVPFVNMLLFIAD